MDEFELIVKREGTDVCPECQSIDTIYRKWEKPNAKKWQGDRKWQIECLNPECHCISNYDDAPTEDIPNTTNTPKINKMPKSNPSEMYYNKPVTTETEKVIFVKDDDEELRGSKIYFQCQECRGMVVYGDLTSAFQEFIGQGCGGICPHCKKDVGFDSIKKVY